MRGGVLQRRWGCLVWCARRGRGVKGRVRLVYKVGGERLFIRNSIPYRMRTQVTDTVVKCRSDWWRRRKGGGGVEEEKFFH